jgi:excisionase family DNA binding protein
MRWKGGALNDIDLALPRSRPATVRTDESTIALVRRLAALYPDAVIAGILNRQGRTTAQGHRFEAGRVGNLRRHWQIPCFEPKPHALDGELLTVKKAASALGVAPSTIHRLLNDGIIPGEQLTSGAPWRIRLTDLSSPSSTMRRARTSCPCARRCARSASHVRPCCNVSSAASWKPVTSQKASKMAYASKL